MRLIAVILVAMATGACSAEKSIPDAGLDYFEAGWQTGWPYPAGQTWRVYSDDQVWLHDYKRDGSGKPDRLVEMQLTGAFARAADVFERNQFENMDPICQPDATMVQPTDQGYTFVGARMHGTVTRVGLECDDGYRHIPEKRAGFGEITKFMQGLIEK